MVKKIIAKRNVAKLCKPKARPAISSLHSADIGPQIVVCTLCRTVLPGVYHERPRGEGAYCGVCLAMCFPLREP